MRKLIGKGFAFMNNQQQMFNKPSTLEDVFIHKSKNDF